MGCVRGCDDERKVIQIAQVDGVLHALCDDGSMWSYSGTSSRPWVRVKNIPQG